MPLNAHQIADLARTLHQATHEGREIERLSVRYPELTLQEAYSVQEAGIRFRGGRGDIQVGMKMGFTSEAERKQMNLGAPIYGVLTQWMQLEDRARFSLQGKIHPKIEPEIAFITSKPLRGRPNAQEALAACSGVCAAMEVLDSRYMGSKYFSLPDVVADNASSSYFVLSRKILPPDACDWSKLEMVLEINGEPRETAISGDPVNSLVQLCELLDERGLYLPANSIVLAGAATQAVQLEAGMEVRLKVKDLGEVSLRAH